MADLLYSWANLEKDFREGKIGYFHGKKTRFRIHKERFPEFIWLVRKKKNKLWLLGKLCITDATPKNFPKKHDPDFIFYDPEKSVFFDNLTYLQTEIEGALSQACGQMKRNNFEGFGSEDILEPSHQRDLVSKTQGAATISFEEMKKQINEGNLPTPPYRLNARNTDIGGCIPLESNSTADHKSIEPHLHSNEFVEVNVTDSDNDEPPGQKPAVVGASDAGLEPKWDEITREIDEECANLEGKDVDAVVKRRVGQGVFRNRLLERFDGACCMTGLTNPRLLIASHIVPWSESIGSQKLDPENGLLLSVSMDALFDKGLISFSSSGRILVGSDLNAHAIGILGLERDFTLPEKLLTDARKENLAKHRERHGFEASL